MKIEITDTQYLNIDYEKKDISCGTGYYSIIGDLKFSLVEKIVNYERSGNDGYRQKSTFERVEYVKQTISKNELLQAIKNFEKTIIKFLQNDSRYLKVYIDTNNLRVIYKYKYSQKIGEEKLKRFTRDIYKEIEKEHIEKINLEYN